MRDRLHHLDDRGWSQASSAITIGKRATGLAAYSVTNRPTCMPWTRNRETLWKVKVDDYPPSSRERLSFMQAFVRADFIAQESNGDPTFSCAVPRGAVAALDAATGERIVKTIRFQRGIPTQKTGPDPPLGPSGARLNAAVIYLKLNFSIYGQSDLAASDSMLP